MQTYTSEPKKINIYLYEIYLRLSIEIKRECKESDRVQCSFIHIYSFFFSHCKALYIVRINVYDDFSWGKVFVVFCRRRRMSLNDDLFF